MANPQSSDIGKGFSWKDPSANLGKWVPLGTEQEWEQRKKELDIKMNLEKEKLEMKRRLMPIPSSTRTPSPVSPLNIKEGIPPKLLPSSIIGLPPLPDGHWYTEVEGSPGMYLVQTLTEEGKKLAGEKPLNNTHPTVLTWLIRYVALDDIITLFYFLHRIGEDQVLRLSSSSLIDTFKILGHTRLYLVPDFNFPRLAEKYVERKPIPEKGVYDPNEIVEPIIR